MISNRDWIEEIKCNLPEDGDATLVLTRPDGVCYLSISREEVSLYQLQQKKKRKLLVSSLVSAIVVSVLIGMAGAGFMFNQEKIISNLSVQIEDVTQELDNTMSAVAHFPFLDSKPDDITNVAKISALSDIISLQDESFRFFVEYTHALSDDGIVQLESSLDSLNIAQAEQNTDTVQTAAVGGLSTTNNVLGVMHHYLEDNLIGQIERHSELLEIKSSLPLMKPLKNARISSRFGLRSDPITRSRELHQGMDLVSYSHPDVFATADGVVEFAGWDANGYGNMVVVQHPNNITTLYAHLREINIEAGQAVNAGDVVGIMGNTGRSTASHLHYEVRVNGNRVNPAILFGIGNNVQ